jgi:hypothetical protein
MTCAFLGGSAGSWLGLRAYAWLGWPAVLPSRSGCGGLPGPVPGHVHLVSAPDAAENPPSVA